MIISKSIRMVVAILIMGYVGFGILGWFLGPSRAEFYSDLFDNEQNLTVKIYSSENFKKPLEALDNNAVSQLISCLKSTKPTLANLGENQDDIFLYIGLESDNYRYKLGIKWRPSINMAYISGVERKVYKRTGEDISYAAFDKIGGTCLDELLSKLAFSKQST